MICDVGDLPEPDLGTVGALARVHLNARRAGDVVSLVNVERALGELIALAGLEELLLGRPQGKPEQREETVGIEESVEADDASV